MHKNLELYRIAGTPQPAPPALACLGPKDTAGDKPRNPMGTPSHIWPEVIPPPASEHSLRDHHAERRDGPENMVPKTDLRAMLFVGQPNSSQIAPGAAWVCDTQRARRRSRGTAATDHPIRMSSRQ